MLAAANTIPVTKAAKQKNSKSSLRIVVMYPCASPGGADRLAQARSPAGARLSRIAHPGRRRSRGARPGGDARGPEAAKAMQAVRLCACGAPLRVGIVTATGCLRRGAVVTRLRRTTIGRGDVAVSPDQPFDRSS